MPLFARALSAIALASLSSTAFADVGGAWRVTGEISGRKFTSDCRFDPRGSQIGGQCVALATGDDKVKPGKLYKLTSGSVTGNQVQWGYPTKVFFMSVDILFAGTLNGDRIGGTISAAGRKGNFTAVRK
ncbi:MAG TPA: hypothetical protein VF475_13620 [Sphingobium sp.]